MELKAIRGGDIHDAVEFHRPANGEYPEDTEYCLKSEVDGVTAEKDKEIAELRQKLHDAEMRADLAEAAETERKIDYKELEDKRRWRKFSEKKPERHQWILVFYPNHSQFTTGVEVRRWDDGCKYDVEVQEIYEKWMPLPEAPKEADK